MLISRWLLGCCFFFLRKRKTSLYGSFSQDQCQCQCIIAKPISKSYYDLLSPKCIFLSEECLQFEGFKLLPWGLWDIGDYLKCLDFVVSCKS